MDSDQIDVFQENEEQSRKIIAEREHTKHVKSCYDTGYHSGLITTIEEIEDKKSLQSFQAGFKAGLQANRTKYQQAALQIYRKYIKKP